MDISPIELAGEYVRAAAQWPYIADIERHYGLPPFLLFAVGSRETNLRNVVSGLQPGGHHGHGIFQLDTPSHTIPAGFDTDPEQQARVAGQMLRSSLAQFSSNHGRFGAVRCALAAYNAGGGTVSYNLAHGLDVDHGTAGGNYSADVVGRLAWLQAHETESHPMSTLDAADVAAIAAAVNGFDHTTSEAQGKVTSTLIGFTAGGERHAAKSHALLLAVCAKLGVHVPAEDR